MTLYDCDIILMSSNNCHWVMKDISRVQTYLHGGRFEHPAKKLVTFDQLPLLRTTFSLQIVVLFSLSFSNFNCCCSPKAKIWKMLRKIFTIHLACVDTFQYLLNSVNPLENFSILS